MMEGEGVRDLSRGADGSITPALWGRIPETGGAELYAPWEAEK